MSPERWEKLKDLCHLALEREPEKRVSFLRDACSGDADLLRDAQSMVARATSGGGILDGPIWKDFGLEVQPAAVSVAEAEPADGPIPETIGRYRILRVIGEGGMGVVYEAEQDQPRRRVALKVIRPGLASAQMLRRFDRESQALALLHHVGIAQIYEAGKAETNHGPEPYFAMEFIHGTPLRQYADSHHLGSKERLEIMAKVCEAVEHAHQNGIIHRDLKPGNILVDETGQPKILDFGVARLTDCDAQVTKQTDLGQLIGTLAYMSPEQVLGDPGQLDNRSDVYALGVILYELLAQRRPYEISDQLLDAVRTIREEDPKRLSSISRAFRGDVETIVAKSLEKDKARRYVSAAAMQADIRKYLADEPITARPASASYQLRKFALRHKALVSATAIVFVVLVAGMIVSTQEAAKARRAELTAEAVNHFLRNDLLAQAGASTQSGSSTKPDPDLKVRTALDRAAAKIDGKFDRQPGVEAAIRETIGQTYDDLGLYGEAQPQLERALELYRRTLGSEDPKTLSASKNLGYLALQEGKNSEAERILTNTVAAERRLLGQEHPETIASMIDLNSVYGKEGQYARAEALASQLLEILRRVSGPEHPDTLKAMHNLALFCHEQGKYDQAEKLDSEIVNIRRRVLGPEHPNTLGAMGNLARDYDAEGKFSEAEALYRQTLDSERRALGPDHPSTLMGMNNLAVFEVEEGKFTEAEVLDRQALEIRKRVLGPEHPDTLQSMHNLAFVNYTEGRYSQAETLLSRTVELRQRVLGREHPLTLLSMRELADAYAMERMYARSEALFAKTVEVSRRVRGREHPQTLGALGDFGFMYQQKGNYAMAENIAAEVVTGMQHSLGSEHPDTLSSMLDLVLARISQRKYSESEPTAREVLAVYENKQPDDWQRFRAESLLGASLAGQKKFAQAEPLLLDGYQGMLSRKIKIAFPDRYHINRAQQWLVQFYQAWGEPDQAAHWRKQ
jgi:tetratricopeptide (TPR) repeat protein/tRNA A-37 threonylcarbamoyl transferase component Bud32